MSLCPVVASVMSTMVSTMCTAASSTSPLVGFALFVVLMMLPAWTETTATAGELFVAALVMLMVTTLLLAVPKAMSAASAATSTTAASAAAMLLLVAFFVVLVDFFVLFWLLGALFAVLTFHDVLNMTRAAFVVAALATLPAAASTAVLTVA